MAKVGKLLIDQLQALKGKTLLLVITVFSLLLTVLLAVSSKYDILVLVKHKAASVVDVAVLLEDEQSRSPSIASNRSVTLNGTRVTCMIFTMVESWTTKARAVRQTWSRRCYRRIFYFSASSKAPHLIRARDAVALQVPEGRKHLTTKTMTALQHAFARYANDTDWFLKADDDTYVVWWNLMRFLAQHDSQRPWYLGRIAMFEGWLLYNSGGGGYALSRPAASLIESGLRDHPDHCRMVGEFEDVEIGRCLHGLNVFPIATLDSQHRMKFHSENPMHFLESEEDSMRARVHFIHYNGVAFGNITVGKSEAMLSNETVTFHYVAPAEMYFIDFLLTSMARPGDS